MNDNKKIGYKKVAMGILSLLLITSLFGCNSQISIENIEADTNNYPIIFKHVFNNQQKSGYYLLNSASNQSIVYYLSDDADKVIKLENLSYYDDKPVSEQNSKCDKYALFPTGWNFIGYGDYIYLIYEKRTVEKGVSYLFSRLDKTASNREDLYEFKDDVPFEFFIQRGKIYFVYGQTDKSTGEQATLIKGFKNDFKVKLPYAVHNCVPNNEYVYFGISATDPHNNQVGRLNLETGKDEILANGMFETVNDDYLAYYTLNKLLDEVSDINDVTLTSHVMSIKDKKDIFTFENQKVSYISNDGFMTYKIRGTQVYQKYDFSQNIIGSITPSELIGDQISDIYTNDGIGDLDYSGIYATHGDTFISTTGKEMLTYLRCDFSTNSCKIIKFPS